VTLKKYEQRQIEMDRILALLLIGILREKEEAEEEEEEEEEEGNDFFHR
jgi:hypothetical protein